MDVISELQEIFRRVFFDDTIVLSGEMTADDIEDWDSLSHMELIREIEKKYDIRFTVTEIKETKNVGEFVDVINRHLASK